MIDIWLFPVIVFWVVGVMFTAGITRWEDDDPWWVRLFQVALIIVLWPALIGVFIDDRN